MSKYGIEKDQRVIDFLRELSRLTRDTGITVSSFDFSNAMILVEGYPQVFGIEYDEENQEYKISSECTAEE